MRSMTTIVTVVLAALLAACSPSSAVPGNESPASGRPAGTVWAIGDSIMVGAGPDLQARQPGIVVDAEVGRSFAQGLRVLEDRLDGSQPPDVLIFALGTNNGASEEQITELVALASNVDDIVLVNVVVPRGWEAGTNGAIAAAAASTTQVRYVDWYGAANGNDAWFRTDGYHPNDEGREHWVDLVVASIG